MKYLISTNAGIGDFVIILLMAQQIKMNDVNARISLFMCSDKNKIKLTEALLDLQNYVDEAFYYSKNEPLHDFRFLLQLGLRKFDFGFKTAHYDAPHMSDWPYRFLKMAAKKVVGLSLQNKPGYVFDIAVPFSAEKSLYRMPLELIKAIGFQVVEKADGVLLNKQKIIAQAADCCRLKEPKKTVALVVGTAEIAVSAGKSGSGSKPAKNWPYSYWNKLSDLLVAKGYTVYLLGGSKELSEIQKIGNMFKNEHIVNLCGKCTINDSMSVICQASLVIGGDTGLMHCAGAVGTPSLWLFGCTSYLQYLFPGKQSFYLTAGKACSPCFTTNRLLTCNDFSCMYELLPETVFNKALQILEADVIDNCCVETIW